MNNWALNAREGKENTHLNSTEKKSVLKREREGDSSLRVKSVSRAISTGDHALFMVYWSLNCLRKKSENNDINQWIYHLSAHTYIKGQSNEQYPVGIKCIRIFPFASILMISFEIYWIFYWVHWIDILSKTMMMMLGELCCR